MNKNTRIIRRIEKNDKERKIKKDIINYMNTMIKENYDMDEAVKEFIINDYNENNKNFEFKISGDTFSPTEENTCSNNGKICSFTYFVDDEGIFLECRTCKHRYPKEPYKLFLPPLIVNQFINFTGVNNNYDNSDNSVNTVNNNEDRLDIYDVKILYPLNNQLFSEREIRICEKILQYHSPKDIVEYFSPYKKLGYYNNEKIYTPETETKYLLLSEDDVYNFFTEFYMDRIDKQIKYYTEHSEQPVINGKNVNKHILMNYSILMDIICDNSKFKSNFLPLIKHKYKIDKFSPYDIQLNIFLSKIRYSYTSSDYIKLVDLYKNYNRWFNDNKFAIKLTKKELQNKVEEYILNNEEFIRINHKHTTQIISGKNILCWKYVRFIE